MTPERAFAAIPASEVDPEVRRIARIAGEIGAAWLRIPHVTLIWVLPQSGAPARPGAARHVNPSNWSGWVYDDEPDRIYVRADMPRHALATVWHELRHLAQLRDGRPLDEDDAERFAERVMQIPLRSTRDDFD